MPRDLIDVIDARAKKAIYQPREGVIIKVSATKALVQRVGPGAPVPCEYDPGQGVAVGKRCTVTWIQGRRYVIGAVFNAPSTVNATDQLPENFELAPPSNLAAASVPGGVLVSWAAPPQQVVLFEVQRSVTADPATAISVAYTRGSQHNDLPGVITSYRVRSISTRWRYSSWSAWVQGTPGAAGGGGADASAIHVNVAGEIVAIAAKATPANNDVILLEDSQDGNKKKRATLASIRSGQSDSDALHKSTANEITSLALKTTPVSADVVVVEDSATGFTKKKATVGSLAGAATDANAFHKTLGQEISGLEEKILAYLNAADVFVLEDGRVNFVNKYRVSLNTLRTYIAGTALHTDVTAEINALTGKTPVAADVLMAEDSASAPTWAKKKITVASLMAGVLHTTVNNEFYSLTEKIPLVGTDAFLIEESAGGVKKKGLLARLPFQTNYSARWPEGAQATLYAALDTLAARPAGVEGPKGDKGDTGYTGAQGLQGIPGIQGDQGIQGIKGDTGSQGLKGDTGDQGIQGVKGDTGERGLQGLKGDKGDTGEQGIQGPPGELNGTAFQLPYTPGDGAKWPDPDPTTVGGALDKLAAGGIGGSGPSTGGLNVSVRVVTAAGSVTLTNTDYVLVLRKTVSAATDVHLPVSPTMGDAFIVKDGKGDAATYAITLIPAAGTIEGAATFSINHNRESISVVYDGTAWNIV